MKKKREYKVYYTDFEKTPETEKYLKSLSDLAKLNLLYEKKLISKTEYDKIKSSIGFKTDF